LLSAVGLENVFFRARPIVLSLARSTMPSSTTLFSNNRKVQRARPLGGLEHASAISLASFSPSKIRATAGVARCGLQQYPRLQQSLRWAFSLPDQRFELLALIRAQPDHIPLYRNLLRSHECPPSPVAAKANHQILTKSFRIG
jgi:hypothetical protein